MIFPWVFKGGVVGTWPFFIVVSGHMYAGFTPGAEIYMTLQLKEIGECGLKD